MTALILYIIPMLKEAAFSHKEIQIKDATILDLPILATMLGKRWDLNKSRVGVPEICNYLYALECYSYSNLLLKITEGGGTLGFTGALIYGCRKKLLRMIFCKILFKIIIMVQPKNIRKSFVRYYKMYSYCPRELEKKFDACGSITIVGRDVKGKGFGKKLILHRECILKEMGVKNLRVDSDTGSDYEFWSHMGFNIVYKSADPIKEEHSQNEYVYVFGKDL